jgi:kojibiose phosphorylase
MNELRAVIFDLDGVITDTAEYHYQAWQLLADEIGVAFDRERNDQLRGVSRRESLRLVLGDHHVDEDQAQELMARKNSHYLSLLGRLTPADVLPGVGDLLAELRAAGLPSAIASASRNTPVVLAALGLADSFDAVVDGRDGLAAKPAPDVFLAAADRLGVPAGQCVVVEDATAGIAGALAAGMWTVGLGPAERVGAAHVRLDDLSGMTLARLREELETAAWTVRERGFAAGSQRHSETIFTIGNGQQCVRGSFEEGYPGDHPAGFMHRLWDDMPVSVSELASLPRWWGADLWVDGDRFRLDRGEVLDVDRSVDLRTGVLTRRVSWRAPSGAVVQLGFERLVDFSEPHRAAVRVSLAADRPVDIRLRGGIDGHVENTGLLHWNLLEQACDTDSAWLLLRTRGTGHGLATACEVVLDTADGTVAGVGTDADGAPGVEHAVGLAAEVPLTWTKFVALVPEFDDAEPVAAARASAAGSRLAGWDALAAANAAAWADFWDDADVTIDGDPEAQLAVRFSIFQLAIAAPAFTDRASIGAKTLSGYGYRHHVFWDTELFMLPLFSYTRPGVAANMLRYRWHGLPGARAKAAGNGYRGAQFPWESAETGEEVTPTWVPDPDDRSALIRIWTGDIEIHITADIALAIVQYLQVSGDERFLLDHGAEIILDGASFWASAAQLEDDGHYHFRNVVGPDEYHDRVDDNAFTNQLAAWHLRTAADLADRLAADSPVRWSELAAQLDLDAASASGWRDVAARIHLARDPQTGLIEQFEGYFALTDPDQAELRDPSRTLSMQQIHGIEGVSRTQSLKQPDVLMLAYLLPELFDERGLRANYDYYDPRTDHELGSSLGPAISAIIACRAGDPQAGYQHFRRAASADLADVRNNASDGIHGASAGGLWQAVVFGFAGLGVTDDGWRTTPNLPAHWSRVRFRFRHRGRRQEVVVEQSR